MKKALLCALSALVLLAAASPAAALFELDTSPVPERNGCALCGAELPPAGAWVCVSCPDSQTGPALSGGAVRDIVGGEPPSEGWLKLSEDGVSGENVPADPEASVAGGNVSASPEVDVSGGDNAAFRADTDYMELMIAAAVQGDTGAGEQARLCRDAKIAMTGAPEVPVDFGELFLLAKLIQAEAGSSWLPAEWKMAVGEVALNRVASPEFPDTLEEVIYQPGQYYSRGSAYFSALLPSEPCARAAARLLSGERVLKDVSVVFQANFPQGGGVFMELSDGSLGTTYLCVSSHPELYTG